MQIERLRCHACQATVEGQFGWPRLARLTADDQRLVELLILASGSLKEVAKKLGISYPTIRKRLDQLIHTLQAEVKRDEERRRQLLREVEAGRRSASDAAQKLRNA